MEWFTWLQKIQPLEDIVNSTDYKMKFQFLVTCSLGESLRLSQAFNVGVTTRIVL